MVSFTQSGKSFCLKAVGCTFVEVKFTTGGRVSLLGVLRMPCKDARGACQTWILLGAGVWDRVQWQVEAKKEASESRSRQSQAKESYGLSPKEATRTSQKLMIRLGLRSQAGTSGPKLRSLQPEKLVSQDSQEGWSLYKLVWKNLEWYLPGMDVAVGEDRGQKHSP